MKWATLGFHINIHLPYHVNHTIIIVSLNLKLKKKPN